MPYREIAGHALLRAHIADDYAAQCDMRAMSDTNAVDQACARTDPGVFANLDVAGDHGAMSNARSATDLNAVRNESAIANTRSRTDLGRVMKYPGGHHRIGHHLYTVTQQDTARVDHLLQVHSAWHAQESDRADNGASADRYIGSD